MVTDNNDKAPEQLAPSDGRFLLVKHSEGWDVDRCNRWMEGAGVDFDRCFPASGQALPDPRHYHGVIVFGGAQSANDLHDVDWLRDELQFIEQCLICDIGFFGICLGAQMLAQVLGARVDRHPEGHTEIGHTRVYPTDAGQAFLNDPLNIMQWHTEGFELPRDATLLATNDVFPNQAFCLHEHVVGVQFHPEVNPDVLAIWHERNKIRRPGQLNDEDRARMMQDSRANDASITDWLDGFLTHWTRLSSALG